MIFLADSEIAEPYTFGGTIPGVFGIICLLLRNDYLLSFALRTDHLNLFKERQFLPSRDASLLTALKDKPKIKRKAFLVRTFIQLFANKTNNVSAI